MVVDWEYFVWLEWVVELVCLDFNVLGKNLFLKFFGCVEWNEGFGKYDVIVDWLCFFLKLIIEVYLDVKVIFIVCDYDKWFESWN